MCFGLLPCTRRGLRLWPGAILLRLSPLPGHTVHSLLTLFQPLIGLKCSDCAPRFVEAVFNPIRPGSTVHLQGAGSHAGCRAIQTPAGVWVLPPRSAGDSWASGGTTSTWGSSPTAQRRGMAPGCGRGLIQARNQETMALGLVERGHKWDILSYNHSERRGPELLLLPQAYHF